MKYLLHNTLYLLFLLMITTPSAADNWQTAQNQEQQGNYADALKNYRQLLNTPAGTSSHLDDALKQSIAMLLKLNRINEADALIDNALKRHPNNADLLQQAGNVYLNLPHYGVLQAGKFVRGQWPTGDNEGFSSQQRDRIRALQLLLRAGRIAPENGQLFIDLAGALFNGQPAWKLQLLTPLDSLPD